MRGENLQEGIRPQIKSGKLIAANIIDPTTGITQYHIVSTKLLNIVVVSIITLLLSGFVVLGLVLYLKINVDYNAQKIEQLEKESVPTNANTP